MLTFTVTLYGKDEHAERNAAQRLWAALDAARDESVAALIGEAKVSLTEPQKGGEP